MWLCPFAECASDAVVTMSHRTHTECAAQHQPLTKFIELSAKTFVLCMRNNLLSCARAYERKKMHTDFGAEERKKSSEMFSANNCHLVETREPRNIANSFCHFLSQISLVWMPFGVWMSGGVFVSPFIRDIRGLLSSPGVCEDIFIVLICPNRTRWVYPKLWNSLRPYPKRINRRMV